MKIRSGFVSNSSSSSFVYLGWRFNVEFEEEFKQILLSYAKQYKSKDYLDYSESYWESADFCMIVDEFFYKIIDCYFTSTDVTFGEKIEEDMLFTEWKQIIKNFEKKCNNKDHVYYYLMEKYGTPKVFILSECT